MKDFGLRDIACFEYLAGKEVRAPEQQERKEKTENWSLVENQSIKKEQDFRITTDKTENQVKNVQ